MADRNICPIASAVVDDGEKEVESMLESLNLTQKDYEYLIGPGRKMLNRTSSIAIKYKVSKKRAEEMIKTIQDSMPTELIVISEEDVNKIESCLAKNPEIIDPEELSFHSEVEEAVVSEYLASRPLTEVQKESIRDKFIKGVSIEDIAKLLESTHTKVQEYVESTFLVFSGKEGNESLQIIEKYTKTPVQELRESIISNDLKFRDDIYKITEQDCEVLKNYFNIFEESKHFFDFKMELTIEDISLINQNTSENIQDISIKIQKVRTVIREYLEQYHSNDEFNKFCIADQRHKIQQLTNFGGYSLTFSSYRMMISNSFDSIIEEVKNKENAFLADIFRDMLPMTFYYLKCNLTLAHVAQIISKACNLSLTTHELFHITFQLSDPDLRGYLIEHYSFSNPVPLFYPKLSTSLTETNLEYTLCGELWYSLQQYNGLVSFGLGRASWYPTGKSSLLDLMFGTDFVSGNPQNSAFHFNSIDIQMTKNLFGKNIENSTNEAIKWAYIDCHRNSNTNVIKRICENLDIALIHITNQDYTNNTDVFNEESKHLVGSVKHCYFLVRDYEGAEVIVERRKRALMDDNYIFIPDLTRTETNIYSVTESLRNIGYEILHLNNLQLIGSEFLERILTEEYLVNIQYDKLLLKRIANQLGKELPFLNYYPLYTTFMSYYYKTFHETGRDTLDEIFLEIEQLEKKLKSSQMGPIVQDFNAILERDNSSLLLWKLSQELAVLSKHSFLTKYGTLQHDLSLEIFWREALLSTKYGDVSDRERADFIANFSTRYSNYVARGEPFELIDGDNLRYFDKEIDELLFDLYEKQKLELDIINEGQNLSIKQAPIVLSVFGPQSSGKSTLLNYCFGCKFLTSAGRCTRGIYASLTQLSRPVNLTNQFLILDTEGLDGIERTNYTETPHIHFDRTMVLFCLAVSQVVIINVKGDIGSELQNLLQICAYSLNKLNVRKVPAPRIFFVLNQQANPDPGMHIKSINILLDKLNTDFMDTEDVPISDLIQVSRDNLFVLPLAFNSELMNKPDSKIFDSEVIKLSSTIAFADQCTKLRLAIIDQLDNMLIDDRTPFKTMNEWIDMSGIIWDSIVRFQDIVKYRNVEEILCSNILGKIVTELMEEYIYSHKEKFLERTDKLSLEIKNIEILSDSKSLLASFMHSFGEIFLPQQELCYTEFKHRCDNHKLLKKNYSVCEESRSNLSRLIYTENKYYEDRLNFQIQAVLVEIKLSQGMKTFQDVIHNNVDKVLGLDVTQQRKAFENMWIECFGEDDEKEEIAERYETLYNLYSIFRMESKAMETIQNIHDMFSSCNFDTAKFISHLKSYIVDRFISNPNSLDGVEQFIFPCNENNYTIKRMKPYSRTMDYQYLSPGSLFVVDKKSTLMRRRRKLVISRWIPSECLPLVKYCSGYFSHPDIVWGSLDRKQQVLLFASQMKSPNAPEQSAWEQLVSDICKSTAHFIHKDPNISPRSVREIVNNLTFLFKLVNYEINYIQGKLTTVAQRTMTTLVFAISFESLWLLKIGKQFEHKAKREAKKIQYFEYFLQKIEYRKISIEHEQQIRRKMRTVDVKIPKQFALDFLSCVKRGLFTSEQPKLDKYFGNRKNTLFYEEIISVANSYITRELENDPETEVLDPDNFVIRYICDRNNEITRLFSELWDKLQVAIFRSIDSEMRQKFYELIQPVKDVIIALLDNLVGPSPLSVTSEHTPWDSDNNFEVAKLESGKQDPIYVNRYIPSKAMVVYLQMYFDPLVSPEQFQDTFKLGNIFVVDGVNVKITETYVLSDKPISPVVSEDLFKKLTNSRMFSSENIFNLYDYITGFLSVLSNYTFNVSSDDFTKLVLHIKERFDKHAFGCSIQCPTCGKFCERRHNHDGRCQIKTGHQICSMGGKVWNTDKQKSAVLLVCDDLKGHTNVVLPNMDISWWDFQWYWGDEWDWIIDQALIDANRVRMKNIWNKFGRGILNYHSARGNHITYVPFTADHLHNLLKCDYYICFVIDGTMSMLTDLRKVRVSVRQFIHKYMRHGNLPNFKIVIYRDHCDKVLLKRFPTDSEFTTEHFRVQQFLSTVKAYGGSDFPEAALDGLATAARKSAWKTTPGVKNLIIHIFDAPPHGAFPDPTVHDSRSNKKHCCCCNYGSICPFNWKTDVWNSIKKNKIKYHGINTGKRIPNFEAAMMENLGVLCGEFQTVGKEMVNDAILEIFIDHDANILH